MSKNWIQKVTKHKSNLTKGAKEHRFMNSDNTIKLNKAYNYAKNHKLTHRLRQINLAKTLEKLRKK